MKIKRLKESFHLIDDDGTSVCIVYYSEDAAQARSAKRLMKDDAQALIQKIARFLDQPESVIVPEIRLPPQE